jgi:hypothetical protein
MSKKSVQNEVLTERDQGESPDSALNALSTVCTDFATRIEQSRSKLQQQYAEQFINYNSVIAASQREIAEAATHAARRYAEDVKEALDPSELALRTEQTGQRFAAVLQQAGNGEHLQREIGRAYGSLLEALSAPPSAGNNREWNEARHRYLSALDKGSEFTETLKEAARLHAEYLVLLRQLNQERWKRLSGAYSAYMKAVNELPSTANVWARAEAAADAAFKVMQQTWQEAREAYAEAWNNAQAKVQKLAEVSRSSSANASRVE